MIAKVYEIHTTCMTKSKSKEMMVSKYVHLTLRK